MIRKIKNGYRCDMCFAKPEFQISGDNRYGELPAFTLHLCKLHAEQLAKSITESVNAEIAFEIALKDLGED